MYSFTRVLTPQDAAITRGIMNVVSITNKTLIPSTPTLYLSPMIHSASSTIWKPVFSGSNCAKMNSDIKKVNPVAASAKRLATKSAAASSPRATTKRISAATAGAKVTNESKSVSIYFAPPVKLIQLTKTTIPITIAKA